MRFFEDASKKDILQKRMKEDDSFEEPPVLF
jgi:hypothetical protein